MYPEILYLKQDPDLTSDPDPDPHWSKMPDPKHFSMTKLTNLLGTITGISLYWHGKGRVLEAKNYKLPNPGPQHCIYPNTCANRDPKAENLRFKGFLVPL